MLRQVSRRDFLSVAAAGSLGGALLPQVIAADLPDGAAQRQKQRTPQLLGNRFFTFNTVVRVRQIETSRDVAHGPDESGIHTPKEARIFRDTVEKAWPGARITWAFSWLALKDERPNYRALKKLVVSYHEQFGDEITFLPGGFFANMYNSREQVSRDLHDGLQMVSDMVGGGYRPKSVIAGFLAAENLRFLAEEEGIHVCQGNIWSQYAVDNGDGDGPIETVLRFGDKVGAEAMLATTATHFDTGFALNKFAWINCIWELCLVEGRKIYGYRGRNGLDGLVIWLKEIRRRWPEAKCVTQGEFGLLWRKTFRNNDAIDYRFIQRGSGIGGSDPDLEIRWFMNKDFRLALLRNWKTNAPEKVIDFTRYDLRAQEPADPKPGRHTRNWSLLNRLNQKGVRPQDEPIAIGELTEEERAIIKSRCSELMEGDFNQ